MSKNSTQCSSVVSQVVKLVSVFVFNKCVGGTKYGERGPGRHLPGPAAGPRLRELSSRSREIVYYRTQPALAGMVMGW